jgi:hypothetical protein
MDEQPSMPADDRSNNHNPSCSDLLALAERELSAFISVVTELFGAEQARLSAEDWLDELESMDELPGSTEREWRLVTIAAAIRLAKAAN